MQISVEWATCIEKNKQKAKPTTNSAMDPLRTTPVSLIVSILEHPKVVARRWIVIYRSSQHSAGNMAAPGRGVLTGVVGTSCLAWLRLTCLSMIAGQRRIVLVATS